MCTCGQHLATSTAKDNQFRYGAEIVRCFACQAQQQVMAKFAKDGGDTAGALIRMTRTPDN